ncbi:molybdopterin-binding protein [Methylomonas sp. AM2-LC]|uniref:competence/damage-inducible protein A n=1 Tax=Methylomonas sp. AM2-LC TaxID=3153301 RepID=UPI0032649811
MTVIAEIFSQGEEVVCGQIADTNAAWLSQQLTDLGFSVARHTAVGDNLSALIALVQEIAVRADCCICTGGLGPTSDDLTSEAVGLATGLALELDAEALADIESYYQQRQRSMPAANRKQAYLPVGAQRINNPIGTAPGFVIHYQRCCFVFLPGVPREMQAMFNRTIQPQLQQLFNLQTASLVTLHSIGIGESVIQQCLQSLVLPEQVQLGYRVTVDDVQTKLKFPPQFAESAKHACVAQAAALMGDYVYAIDGIGTAQGDLLSVINQLLVAKNYSLAILETASQGLMSAKCAGRAWLKSVDVYVNQQQIFDKTQVKVTSDALNTCVASLAKALKTQQQTDLALVQLYHSDAGDKDNAASYDLAVSHDPKIPIVLYNALITTDNTVHLSQHQVLGTQQHKQNQAAILSLDLLRRYLQNKCH